MIELLTAENMIALATLASLEIVLGIDNIVFIAIITSRLPAAKQPMARRIGLLMAMGQRILLLFCISWLAQLTEPLLTLFGKAFSGRDLILLIGGLFLLAKATYEIHGMVENVEDKSHLKAGKASLTNILIQITILDIVFSLDSVITAVGMVDDVAIMVIAVILSVIVMMIFANPISQFILKHPTVKMLALSFLLLIGMVLVADGFGHKIEKAYIYFAIFFAILIEGLNFRLRKKVSAVQ
jgi:predicted tellurium resistance membrane protein TerC